MLVFRMTTSKTGVSINELARRFEIKDYKTVWTMVYRNAQAGLVEIDEQSFSPVFLVREAEEQRRKNKLITVAVSIYKDNI